MKNNKLLKTLALALAISSLGAIAPNTVLIKANAASNWSSVNNVWYYIDGTGKVTTGWVKVGDDWFYLDSNGAMKTGWFQVDGNWYYCWSTGELAINTTVGGYYLNASGVWTVSAASALTWAHVYGKHVMNVQLSIRNEDQIANDILTNYNIDLSNSDDKSNLHDLVYNLTKETFPLEEARAKCIGKIVGGKFVIKDIKYFGQVFKDTQGTASDERVKTVKENNVYAYKTTSSYFYDETKIFSCFNERSTEWEARRVVVEFGAI